MVVEALLGGPPNHKNHQLHKLFGIALAQKAYIPVHSIHLLRLPLSLSLRTLPSTAKCPKAIVLGALKQGSLGFALATDPSSLLGAPNALLDRLNL